MITWMIEGWWVLILTFLAGAVMGPPLAMILLDWWLGTFDAN